jgi:hypothetical protein
MVCLVELPANCSRAGGGSRGRSGAGTSPPAGTAEQPQPSAGRNAAQQRQTVIGLCVLDVTSGQCQVSSCCTADDPARSGLAAALLAADPVEVVAVRDNLHPATATVVKRHCEINMGSSSSSSSPASWAEAANGSSSAAIRHVPGLSYMSSLAASKVLEAPATHLREVLPPQIWAKLQDALDSEAVPGPADDGLRHRTHQTAGTWQAQAAFAAVAVAVWQLQRCKLDDSVLPTLDLQVLQGLGNRTLGSAAAHKLGEVAVCNPRSCGVPALLVAGTHVVLPMNVLALPEGHQVSAGPCRTAGDEMPSGVHGGLCQGYSFPGPPGSLHSAMKVGRLAMSCRFPSRCL